MQDANRTYLEAGPSGARRSADAHRRLNTAGLVVIIALAAASALRASDDAPRDGAAPESIARLHPRAVVTTEQILLSDVAELTGPGADLIADSPIAFAPSAGHTRIIALEDLQRAFEKLGANRALWVFRGSSRCEVSRPAPVRRSFSEKPGESTSDVGTDARDVTTYGRPASTLADVLRDYLRDVVGDLDGEPVAQFSPAAEHVLQLSRPTYDFKVTRRGTARLGLVPLQVTIYEKDLVKQTLPVLANVALRRNVVVAARSINRNETIEADALRIEEKLFDRPEGLGLTDMTPLLGQRAKRFIKEGSLVNATDTEPVPMVKRNDIVTVWAQRGPLRVKGAARATEEGLYGQRIQVRNDGSRETYAVTVVGPKSVEIESPNAAAQAAKLGHEGRP
jgi:flagella basal body P-ring formation protein FlgA